MTRRAGSIFVFGLALVARLAFQIGAVGMNAPPRDDAALYDSVAVSVSHGGPYVDAEGYRSRRPPAFPLLLAGLYAAVGHDWRAARILQALIGAATCSLVLLLGAAWMEFRIGLTAALVCAVFPYTVYWSAHLLTDTRYHPHELIDWPTQHIGIEKTKRAGGLIA